MHIPRFLRGILRGFVNPLTIFLIGEFLRIRPLKNNPVSSSDQWPKSKDWDISANMNLDISLYKFSSLGTLSLSFLDNQRYHVSYTDLEKFNEQTYVKQITNIHVRMRNITRVRKFKHVHMNTNVNYNNNCAWNLVFLYNSGDTQRYIQMCNVSRLSKRPTKFISKVIDYVALYIDQYRLL